MKTVLIQLKSIAVIKACYLLSTNFINERESNFTFIWLFALNEICKTSLCEVKGSSAICVGPIKCDLISETILFVLDFYGYC